MVKRIFENYYSRSASELTIAIIVVSGILVATSRRLIVVYRYTRTAGLLYCPYKLALALNGASVTTDVLILRCVENGSEVIGSHIRAGYNCAYLSCIHSRQCFLLQHVALSFMSV